MLSGHQVRVIMYVRNVHEYARSAFQQHLKYPDRRRTVVNSYNVIRRNLNYDALLKRWQAFLPDEAIDVRLYDAEKHNLLAAFFSRLGVPAHCVAERQSDIWNPSIDPSLQILLACIGNDRAGSYFRHTRDTFFKTFKGRKYASVLMAEAIEIICAGVEQHVSNPLLDTMREGLLAKPPKPEGLTIREQADYFTSLARFSRRMARRKKFEASALYPLWLWLRDKMPVSRKPTH